MSKSAIDRLGASMRDDPNSPTDEHRNSFAVVREIYAVAMEEAITVMDGLGIDTVFREKNLGTVIEKLRRESTRLSQMDDIVGGRVTEVLDTLLDQDDMVRGIVSAFPGAQVKDRRTTPSHGYRAVHVIAFPAGCRVELQVRTRRQDAWAQLQERLADEWGRDIKYGGDPADPDAITAAGVSRQLIVHTMMSMSGSIRTIERLEAALVRERALPDFERDDYSLEAIEFELEERDRALDTVLDLVSQAL